ncbi:Winged helix DNA-binding domain-containing protein [Blastococcus mobilis]|uniref:Winged helix DNA-binding domain-containing protein n=2 Tax=Blastococcus mobilis TaxID=1938746 RepID=A0A238YPL7_9ACTN|nr:Winged helix DNA-binding domain-containing protein [Blastococcus mobilis]
MRLVAQRLAGPRPATATEVVRLLTAVQAQDLPGALLSVALRSEPGTRTDVESALNTGDVVRSWPMRGTLHLTAAEDLPWMIDLLGPRVLAGSPARRTRLGITDADIEKARELAVQALAGGRQLRRAEILAALTDGGVEITGQRGYHLLWYLSQTCTLCLGPIQDGEQRFVLMDEWIRSPRRLGTEEALGELAERFFRGHGPATVQDLARWVDLRVTEARAALAAARDGLARLEADGVEYFLARETPDLLAEHRDEALGVRLLPGFDEFVLGYADRTCAVPPEFADRIVPGGNGMFRPTVVSGGRVVGTWGYTGRGSKRTVTATPFTVFPAGVEAALPALAAALP